MPGRIFEAKVDKLLTVIFTAIDFNLDLVSGLAATITTQLRDEDGAAAEAVTVTEQGTSGFYEASFTPTRSKATGHTYLLRYRRPPGTNEGIDEDTILVFPSVSVSGITGNFLTTLASVKEHMKITTTAEDAYLTNLIARVSRIIEARRDVNIVEQSYQEIRDGNGRDTMSLRHRPVSAVAALYESLDQTWDSTTQIAAADFLIDGRLGRIHLKGGRFDLAFQNVRADYTAGFATIPLKYEHAANVIVSMEFNRRRNADMASWSLKDGSVTKRVGQEQYGRVLAGLGVSISREVA